MRGVWLLGIVGAIGCGPSSWDDFRNQLGDRVCAQAVRCGALPASEQKIACPVPWDVLGKIGPMNGLDVAGEIKAGRMQFNSDGAQDCLDAVGGSPCDPSALEARIALRCHHVIAPNVAGGGVCRGSGECVGGTCGSAFNGCPSICTSYPPPGTACDPQGFGTTCDPTVQYCGQPHPGGFDGGVPEATVCLRHKQRGDACDVDEECSFGLVCTAKTCGDLPHQQKGDLCTAAGTLCAEDVYCDTTGHCVDVKGKDQPCDAANACKKGFACLGLKTMPSLTPGVCSPWLDVGQACDNTAQINGCPNNLCGNNGSCGVLVPLVVAGPRQSCVSLTCAQGLYCDGALCQYLSNEGGDCTRSDNACGFLQCDHTTHTCVSSNTCH